MVIKGPPAKGINPEPSFEQPAPENPEAGFLFV
jgi:hypothetical protein